MANLDGDTALHVAVQYGNFDVVEELIKVDPEMAKYINKAGESALFLAVDKELCDMASQILTVAPEYCSYAGRHGMNVLHALVLHTCCYINKGNSLSLKKWRHTDKYLYIDRCIVTCAWVINMLFLTPVQESEMRTNSELIRTLQRTFGTIPEGLSSDTDEVILKDAFGRCGELIQGVGWQCVMHTSKKTTWILGCCYCTKV